MNCPCCNNTRGHKPYDKTKISLLDVYRCKCGAVFGQCYKGDSYAVVRPQWHVGEAESADTFYFDLTVVGSAGVERRHGWAHKVTRGIVQVG